MQNPVIIFFGNTRYSKLGAEIVNKAYPISLFVTIPDREVGRKKELSPSPIKELALQVKSPFLELEKITPEVIEQIKKLSPDFLVVEDYGLILPNSLLALPKYAPLNIHHSLLPKYRGPSPAPSTILAGEKESGVTIIKMTDKVDAGNILDQQEYELSENETTDSLLTTLNKMGGQLMVEVIKQFLEDQEKPAPQDETQATLTKFMKKTDGYFEIDTPPSPEVLDRMIRAYFPWPTAWTKWSGKIVKFLPGKMIQMEGKKPVSLEEFKRGHPQFPSNLFLP